MEFAIVKAGHDRGKIYLIHHEEGEFVYLVNGDNRIIEKPKKKNRRHIQIIKHYPEEINIIMEEKVPIDQRIKKSIKCLNAHINNQSPMNKQEEEKCQKQM